LNLHSKLTVGRSVSSLYLLRDLDNTEGAFFVFSEMSVRAEGTYRLRMSLFDMESSHVCFRESITTDEFSVYSAKKFPGMYESCPLARSFADQGLKIRIRKESKTRKRESARKASTKKAHSEAIVSNEPYESICTFEDEDDSQDGESMDIESDQFDNPDNQNYYEEMVLTTRSSISNQSVTTACSYPDEYGAPHNDDYALTVPTRDSLINMDTDPIEKQAYKPSTADNVHGQYIVSSLISGKEGGITRGLGWLTFQTPLDCIVSICI
ncbi:velvet factor-domain-containing protein, partial [Phycomyces nitens]